jgi:hypothetical protein
MENSFHQSMSHFRSLKTFCKMGPLLFLAYLVMQEPVQEEE